MSARSALSTDHDEFLERVLPHVDTGVISRARDAIAQDAGCWDDDGAADADEDPRLGGLPGRGAGPRRSLSSHRSARTRSNSTSDFSEFTYAGRGTFGLGGLSPPRRAALFANFDGGFAEAAEGGRPEDEGPWRGGGGGGGVGGGAAPQTPAESLMEPAEVSRRTGSRASGSRASASQAGASSPKPRGKGDGGSLQSPFEVPVRLSSRGEGKHANGQGGVGAGRTRRSSVIIEQQAGDASRHDAREARRRSPVPPEEETSSTPPPISHARPTRMLTIEDFENDAGVHDGFDHGWEEVDLGAIPGPAAMAPSGGFELGRKQPASSSSRNRNGPLGSLARDGSRGASERERGVSSRSTTLTQNYRDLRTPMLNHVQMYQDAESRRPMDDRAAPRQGMGVGAYHAQKQYRSHDDGLHNGYVVGGAGPVAAGAAHDPYLMAMMRSGNMNNNNNSNNASLRRTYSDDDISIRQRSLSGRTAGGSSGVAVGSMPDFFSAAVFQVVLHNPTTAHQLLRFAEMRLCAENVAFLARVDEYRATLNTLATQLAGIHKVFISPASASQINISQSLLRAAHRDMKGIVNQALPSMETVFADLQEHIEGMVYQDIYPRFVRHQMALSASRALGGDRFRYQGLGDCFCMTNPNIADNPIVYASDGFVKVTGYTRPEIIPRNCRFLQGAHTDRRPVDRLKAAISEREESVELILNYKKNGDPFWNLLYVAPLFNASGKTEFFIGGQVNCSTTIHSNVDVMKVLSLSATGEAEQENESLRGPAAAAAAARQQQQQQQQQTRPSARRTLLRAFGVVRPDDRVPAPRGPVDTGMEDGVLGRMQGQDLTGQMKEFYTAYSRYLVVRASSYTIQFHSEGLVEALGPAATNGVAVEGADVFKFLGQSMIARQTEYRARVRTAMRAGIPVSTALRLQTARSAVFRGDEAFLAHWTPLKDEQAVVHWIVVTLAPAGL